MKNVGTLIFWITIPIVCFLVVDAKYRGENSVWNSIVKNGDISSSLEATTPYTSDKGLMSIEEDLLVDKLSAERYYAYHHLSDEEQQVYRRIYDLLLDHKPNKEIKIMQEDLIDKVWTCVLYDNPEIFYVSGFTKVEYSNGLGKIDGIGFLANYTMTEEEIEQHQDQINKVVKEIVDNAPQTGDFDRVKYVYDYLIQNTEYDNESYERHLANENVDTSFNLVSVFENHKTVCSGYAKGFQYLCNKLDIPCTFISGVADNGVAIDGHAWNLVKVDGDWYFVDVTWGDDSFMSTNGIDIDKDYTNYAYLCATTEDISTTHTIDMPYEVENCTAVKDNYYVRNGLYFTDINETALQSVFSTNTNNLVVLKCNSADLCQQLKHYLIDENKLYNYVQQYQGYAVIEKQNEIMIVL